jgi:hypothetical protein
MEAVIQENVCQHTQQQGEETRIIHSSITSLIGQNILNKLIKIENKSTVEQSLKKLGRFVACYPKIEAKIHKLLKNDPKAQIHLRVMFSIYNLLMLSLPGYHLSKTFMPCFEPVVKKLPNLSDTTVKINTYFLTLARSEAKITESAKNNNDLNEKFISDFYHKNKSIDFFTTQTNQEVINETQQKEIRVLTYLNSLIKKCLDEDEAKTETDTSISSENESEPELDIDNHDNEEIYGFGNISITPRQGECVSILMFAMVVAVLAFHIFNNQSHFQKY